nr:serine palmitoyltransferase 2 [Andalucia godoyi]|eukprot:ANDGO_03769.mRNA.1 Long chain base biosynthesis protein 2b
MGAKHQQGTKQKQPLNSGLHEACPSWITIVTTYFSYFILFLFGRVRDTFRTRVTVSQGYAPLTRDFEDFWTRRAYRRIRDCWNRPVCGVPGAYIDVLDRESSDYNATFTIHKTFKQCLNLGSYNYLGFGQSAGLCTDSAIDLLRSSGQSMCSTRREMGTHPAHVELENTVAKFVGKPAAIVLGMGYATNSTTIPLILCHKGDLVISDSQNHSSLVSGVRGSRATVRVFRHNDPEDLERVLRKCISEGQPRSGRPWKKILVVVEGIDSMGGDVGRLVEIVALKKKYNCYLYLDEAHSIGAMGPSGRGICEHLGVDPADVDILMGTFTKSFGSVGGYVAASADLVHYLKRSCWAQNYATSMSPACAQQALSALWCIMGMQPLVVRSGRDIGKEPKSLPANSTEVGPKRIASLHDNANYFRSRMQAMGFEVLGDKDSPVVPVLTYQPAKMPSISRYCLKHSLAVVVVGFPATPLIESRIRFCISAAHTKEDIDYALEVLSRAGDLFMFKYFKHAPRISNDLKGYQPAHSSS